MQHSFFQQVRNLTIEKHLVLKSSNINTPLGQMLAIADQEALYVLSFTDSKNLTADLNKICLLTNATITQGKTAAISAITTELQAYFAGKLKKFQTKVKLLGTPFQKMVWDKLMRVPYGQTSSYMRQAQAIGRQLAYRAVANANGKNQLAIIIPCHRIIQSDGKIGGYSSGIERKEWLLKHENKKLSKAS